MSGRAATRARSANAAAALAWLRQALAALAQLRPRSLPRALAAAASRVSPRMRRWLLAGAATCLVLAAGYQLWLRDSSLVAVDKVTITGLTTSDAERVRVALTGAARTMTTLHVDRGALDQAVQGYPVVRELEVSADFPHGLEIRVIEHHPAAIAVGDDGRMPVAGDGTILRGLPVEGHLPTIDVKGSLGTTRLGDTTARAAAAVAGAAPAALRSRMTDVHEDSTDGLVATMHDGPDLIFGNARRIRAKWAAAARVLADLDARGASYVDLRIPGRPAAGGLSSQTIAPVAPAGTTTPTTSTGTTSTGTTSTGAAAATQPTTPAAPTTGTPTTGTPPPTSTATPTQTATPPAQSTAPATGTAQGGAAAPAGTSP